MSSTFAFTPYGISQPVTVTIATSSFTLTIFDSTGTGTVQVTNGAFVPGGVRIANEGANAAYVLFTPTTATTTLGATSGMFIPGNTVEKFRLSGQNRFLLVSAGATTTLNLTAGEGI